MIQFLRDGHKNFIKYNLKKKNYFTKNKNKILIDYFDDYPTIFAFSSMKNYLINKYNANLEYFTFNSWQNCQLNINRSFLENIRAIINFFGSDRILRKIYYSFGVKKGLIIDYNNFFFKKIAQTHAKKEFLRLKKIEDIYLINYKKFNLGKYIYQSFLRDYSKPTISINDKRLYKIIKKAILIYLNIDAYFKKNKVKLLIPSHTVYLSYGIITEYAFKKKIKVFRVKSPGYRDQESLKLIRVDSRISELYNTKNYKKVFDSFDYSLKKKYREIGKKILLNRYNGKIEPNLARQTIIYHTKKNKIKIPNNKKNILIFIPCFFDGPGRNEKSLFPDFFQWVIFMIENAKNTDFNWYIKPHPLGLPENELIISNLKKKYFQYKNIIFLDKETSNKYLISQNFKSIFLHHGNAVAEFAHKKFPVIVSCLDNTSSFNIAIRAKTKENLKKFIINADKIIFNVNKNNIYEFIYMHFENYLGYKKEERIFKKCLNQNIASFHNLNNPNINSHKFFGLFDDSDYIYAEKKLPRLLKKIRI